jgi:hypothetical protein
MAEKEFEKAEGAGEADRRPSVPAEQAGDLTSWMVSPSCDISVVSQAYPIALQAKLTGRPS